MSKRRFGLSAKFVLIIVSFLTLLFLVFSFVLVRFNVRTLSNNLDQETKSFTQLSSQPIGDAFLTYSDSGRIRIAQVVQRYADLDPNITNFGVVDTQGNVQFLQYGTSTRPVSALDASSFTPVYSYNDAGNIDRAVVPFFEESGAHRYSVVYDVTDESVRQNVARQVQLIGVFAAVGMLASVVVMYVLVDHHFINPIKLLSRQAMSISSGDINRQINIDRHDEVADLAEAVNHMAASLRSDIRKLEELDTLKSEFLTIVSHNLRTPLTIIKGYLDNADDAKTLDEMQEIIEKLKIGSQRLSVFTEDMLVVAELESGQPIGNRKLINVPSFVNRLADDFSMQPKVKAIKFVRNIRSGTYNIKINESLVGGVVWNLLDNALKFTKPSGSIELSTDYDEKSVTIDVKDSGIGISAEEIPKLFTKFHRGTSTLVYDYEGTGIGLYSSNLIIKEHGGTIAVESKLGEGSTLTITLPLAPE